MDWSYYVAVTKAKDVPFIKILIAISVLANMFWF
jgi:hypothetical protein